MIAPVKAQRTRIVVADDHAIVREGLTRLLCAEPDLDVVAEATDGPTTVERVRQLRPDITIMNISMPRCGGTRAVTDILRYHPDGRIIALSMQEEPGFLRELVAAGVAGYVLMRSATEELLRAVRTVAGGGLFFDSALTGSLLRALTHKTEPQGAGLSEREATVLRLLAQGYSHKEIAARLTLSIKTVETYKTRSMEKLNLRSRVDMVRYAYHSGWLDDL